LHDFADLVQANPALRQGAQIHRYSETNAGIYAFSRIDRDEKVEYLVALNNAEAADSATFGTDSPDTNFTEIWPGGGTAVTSTVDGDVTIDVPALGVKVYRADAPIPAGSLAPSIALNTPAEGAEVLGRIEVGATVGTSRFVEVTFAVSVDGGPYEPIGTDDNAPYRIFYDVSGLAPGTPLTFKAIVNDLSGNLASNKVNVVVGMEVPPTVSGFDYAVVHYNRPAGDYETAATGDYWGLHLWGDAIDPSEVTDWAAPKPFEGEDEFGRFAWIKRGGSDSQVNFIIHQGDTKDTEFDRFFDANANTQIWINQGYETVYTTQADAQGFVIVRYHRDDGDYGDPTSPDYNDFFGLHLWGDAIDPTEGTGWTTPKPFDGVDDYGAFWEILIQDSSQPVNFIIHRGYTKDPGPDESFIPAEIPTVWKQSGDLEIYPSRGAAEDFATIHYHRDDGDYGDPTSSDFNNFWGMHVWTGALNPNPSWTEPLRWIDLDVFGPVFEVELVDGAPELAYILHRGDAKDPGPDQLLSFDPWGYEVWQLSGADPEKPYVLPIIGEGAAPGDITTQQAYWVAEDTIAWAAGGDPSADYRLYYAPTGGMTLGAVDIEGGSFVELSHGAPFPGGIDGFFNLAGLPTLKISPADLGLVPDMLKGQIAVQVTKNGGRLDATGLQIPGVLDDLYTYNGELGVTWAGDVPTISVWAPTAKSVTFHLFDDSDVATTSTTMLMTRDDTSGVWSITGDSSWKSKFYLFEVEVYVHSTGQVEHNLVTDPYSLSLAMNSTRSQIVDLNDAALKPAGWDETSKPELVAPEDISIYEIHVRDFSVNDESVPEELRGTYKAFTLEGTNGVKHLQALQEAGLSHLHLLPVFDIATINENKAEWQETDWTVLETYPPDSDQQQAAVTATEDLDG
ncbi:MAG: pullulanase-associated domain-containing protein, partial [Thermoanaerobaculia bacterium]